MFYFLSSNSINILFVSGLLMFDGAVDDADFTKICNDMDEKVGGDFLRFVQSLFRVRGEQNN